MRLTPRTVEQPDSPISTTYALLDGHVHQRPLLDLAQAAPQYPPPAAVVEHIAATARDAHGAEYTDIAGIPALREVFAAELSRDYAGVVTPDQVSITAGCNQAFCLVASTLADAGDEIILALPYYFNHDMWLRLSGIAPVYVEPGPDGVPTPEAVEALVTSRTRAILLVSPGNPSGVTMSPAAIGAVAAVAARHEVALVIDETYRSFRDEQGPAHTLFADPDWPATVISLHSFSKDLALPGYRVGAIVSSVEFGDEVAKLLDCVAVCAPRIGQEAAWAGLTMEQQWRRDRADDVAQSRRLFGEMMSSQPGGFELVSSGGFFGWVRHPFAGRSTEDVVADLLRNQDVLVIPGTAFLPEDRGLFRVSIGNLDAAGVTELAARLTEAGPAAS